MLKWTLGIIGKWMNPIQILGFLRVLVSCQTKD